MKSKTVIFASVFALTSTVHAQDLNIETSVALRVDPAENAISGKCEIIADDGARSTQPVKAGVAEQGWDGVGAECTIKNDGATAVTVDMVTKVLSIERGGCQGSTTKSDGSGISFSSGSCPFTIKPGVQAKIVINNA